jgi:hypothetical protein
LWRRRAHYERPGGIDLGTVADDLLHHESMRHFRDNWKLDPQLVRQHLTGVEPIAFEDVLRRLYELWALSVGKPRYGDKTPSYVLAMQELGDVFPEARFIHVIRDGRDVALSLLQLAHPDHPRTVGRTARQWADWVRGGRAAGARLESGRYLEVHYEDLVTEPEIVLRSICDFIALEFSPLMLRPQDRGRSAVPEHERWQHPNLDLPPTPGLRNWREDMPPADVARFEAIAGRQLEAAGYERALARVPLSARVASLPITGRTILHRAAAKAKSWLR